MKRSFSTDMCAHVWAQQTQSEGYGPNKSIYFEDSRIYSYGAHYCIGMIMPDGVTLLNDSRYSVTTSKHRTMVRYAVSNRTRIYVPDLTGITDLLGVINSTPPADRRQYRAHMRGVVKARLGTGYDMRDDTSEYLLGLVGFKLTELEKIKNEVLRDRLRDTALANKKRLAMAKQLAKTPFEPSRLVNPDKWQILRAVEQNRKQARDTFRDLRDLKGKLSARDIAALKARRAAQLAYAAKYERVLERDESRGKVRNILKLIRKQKEIDQYFSVGTYLGWLENLAIHGSRYMTNATRVQLAVSTRAARAAYEAKKRAQKADQFAWEAIKRQEWLDGIGSSHGRYSDELGGALLRIKGDTLETSHGASVPLAHAIKVFQFVKLVKQRGKPWHTNGKTIRVGHFTLTSIDTSGNFVAGCHRINWPEIERVAKLANVFDLEVSEGALS